MAIGVVWASPAAAACSGPQVTVTPQVATPGEPILVNGQGFGTACNDTGPQNGSALGEPQTDVSIYIDLEGGRQLLGTVDADSEYQLAAAPWIPVSSPSGTGSIVLVASDSGDWPAEVSAPIEIVAGPVTRTDDPPIVGVIDTTAESNDSWFSPLSFLVGAVLVGVVAGLAVARHQRGAGRA